MKINQTQNVSFKARLATLGDTAYTREQRKLVSSVVKYLCSDTFLPTGQKFDKITNNCFIIAKPVGKTGIQFQACLKQEDFAENTQWYDKFYPDMDTTTSTTRTKKDTIENFDNLVDRLSYLSFDDFYECTVNYDKPMANPPKNLNVLV